MSHSQFAITRVTKRQGATLPMHAHDEAQLTFAFSGMVQVATADGVWLVPQNLAAWIPPGVPHRLEALTDAELWLVHWQSAALQYWRPAISLERAFALRVTPLLGSLLDNAVSSDTHPEKIELLVRLMLHELIAMPDAPTFLPLPASRVGQRVAEIALADHRNLMTLEALAAQGATSVRTISRLFPAETGLTLKAWRQRARIVRAMQWLAKGETIANVATRVGFSSTAAFSYAFRKVSGMTPTTFLGKRVHEGS
ncbi:AraC family transcriptional regulator [Salinicola aestuarinus]|uniref:AraC family transcriptional regulator n=1 Tax=Salinicola aestuarinus TaxID=1949082 RepID=UPI000DA15BC3|nr:helix-turn-helix transcriptional regulator [Salinicola aestuarinus]